MYTTTIYTYRCGCEANRFFRCLSVNLRSSTNTLSREPTIHQIRLTVPCDHHTRYPSRAQNLSTTILSHIGFSRERAAKFKLSIHARRVREAELGVSLANRLSAVLSSAKKLLRKSQFSAQRKCNEAYAMFDGLSFGAGLVAHAAAPAPGAEEERVNAWLGTLPVPAAGNGNENGDPVAEFRNSAVSPRHRQAGSFSEQELQRISQEQDYFDPISSAPAAPREAAPAQEDQHPHPLRFHPVVMTPPDRPRAPMNLNRHLPPAPARANDELPAQTPAQGHRNAAASSSAAAELIINRANETEAQLSQSASWTQLPPSTVQETDAQPSQPANSVQAPPTNQWDTGEVLGSGQIPLVVDLAGRVAVQRRRRLRNGNAV